MLWNTVRELSNYDLLMQTPEHNQIKNQKYGPCWYSTVDYNSTVCMLLQRSSPCADLCVKFWDRPPKEGVAPLLRLKLGKNKAHVTDH